MTLKWAFINAAVGGAKGGIFADPDQLGCTRVSLMESFGRAIAPLVHERRYFPGIDLGTTLDDLDAILRGAGRTLDPGPIDGSWCTALTVFESIRQGVNFLGQELRGQRVVLEGFGKVGSSLARLLDQAGARLVALSTEEGAVITDDGLDVSHLLTLKGRHGDCLVVSIPGVRRLASKELYFQDFDILVPGAHVHVLHGGNAGRVRARLIVAIANAPLTTEAEELLTTRGTLVFPDFVTNAGGVLSSELSGAGFTLRDFEFVVMVVYSQVLRRLFEVAACDGITVCEVAPRLAWNNHAELNKDTPTPGGLFQRAGGAWKVHGWRGVKNRMAWRIYKNNRHIPEGLRQAALERYMEFTLGKTLAWLDARLNNK